MDEEDFEAFVVFAGIGEEFCMDEKELLLLEGLLGQNSAHDMSVEELLSLEQQMRADEDEYDAVWYFSDSNSDNEEHDNTEHLSFNLSIPLSSIDTSAFEISVISMEGSKQDSNKENIPPSISSKQITNTFVHFHSKSIKCRKFTARKPLQDITHLFNSSFSLHSRSNPLFSPLLGVFVHESNLRKRKSLLVDGHLKYGVFAKSLRMNFR
ncbi:hypothetical protein BVRB_4g082140 [Beta vulgaris subsp. vulgaris]|nr:hypothetical protein BVRB_4g082140 [Beta vulgaris subsp. vulgaris]